jgi:hypothetical protein
MELIFFQPPGINSQYCEVGFILQKYPDYIWYGDEPCQILKTEVNIIPNEMVLFDKKKRSYKVIINN